MSKKIEFTDEQINDIIEQYKKGISKRAIARSLGNFGDKCITRILKQYNIAPQDKYIPHKNDHIFDIIDTADKAYWLGFITGDGCIHQDRTFLSIKCARIDKQHLVKFTRFMSMPETAVKDGKGSYNNEINYMYVTSKHLIQTLRNKGIEPNKSGHEHVPSGIPNEFVRDYLRGLIDADGHIADCSTGQYRIDLSNSIENIQFMMDYFHNNFQLKLKKIYDNENTYRVFYRDLFSVYTIVNHLYYSDNITYLDRKYERAKEIIKLYQKREPQQNKTT